MSSKESVSIAFSQTFLSFSMENVSTKAINLFNLEFKYKFLCTSSFVRPANMHSCSTVKALFKAGRKIILVSSCPVGQNISVFS